MQQANLPELSSHLCQASKSFGMTQQENRTQVFQRSNHYTKADALTLQQLKADWWGQLTESDC